MDRVEKIRELSESIREKLRKGENCYEDKKQLSLIHLDQHEELPYEVDVRISAVKDCCSQCRKNSERIISIEQAYAEMMVPNKHCTHPSGCRCRFLLIPKRDSGNNLIMKKQSEPISDEELKRQVALAAYQKVADKVYSNTSYGRRKERERTALYRQALMSGDRKAFDRNALIVFVIVIVAVLVILYLIGGEKAVTKWMQR